MASSSSNADTNDNEPSDLYTIEAVYDNANEAAIEVMWNNCEAGDTLETMTGECIVDEVAIPADDESAVSRFRELIQRDVPLHPVQRFESNDEVSDDDESTGKPTIVIERLEDVNEDSGDAYGPYLMDVIAVEYATKCPLRKPMTCSICWNDGNRARVSFVTFLDLLKHTRLYHKTAEDSNWLCCLGDCACVEQQPFGDERTWKNHIFLVHGDLLEANLLLKCPTCAYTFESVVQFGKHICELDSLPSAGITKCADCDKTFATERRLKFHMLHRHPLPSASVSCANYGVPVRQCVCLACGRAFADEQRFYDHVSFEHERYALFVCSVCDQCFTNGIECERHQRAHGAVRRYKCVVCDASFVTRAHLNMHRNIHRSDRLRCQHCPKSFKRISILHQHVHRTHAQFESQKLPFCRACGEVFTNKDKAAQWQHHHPCDAVDSTVSRTQCNGEFTELFCCEFCERAFGQADQLASHRELRKCHNTEHKNAKENTDNADAKADTKDDSNRRFACLICSKTFDAFGKRMNHWRSHRGHPDLPSASTVRRCYVCDVAECGRRFPDWPTLQQHRKGSHLIGPTVMRCAECDAVFYQSWRLAHHRRVAHEERMRCPICPASFVQTSSLNVHMLRMHIDEQRPISDVHGYRNRVIEEHFSRDTEDGSFTCLKCGKKSTRRKNAIAHAEAVHMRLRDFDCDRCEASFFGQGDLRKHQRRRHGAKETSAEKAAGRAVMVECAYCGHQDHSKVRLREHMLKEHVHS